MILALTTTHALHTGQCKHTGHTGCSTTMHSPARHSTGCCWPKHTIVQLCYVVTCMLLLPHTAAAGVTQNAWPGYHHTESRALAALVPKNRLSEPPATQLSNRGPLQRWPLHRRQQQGKVTARKTTSQRCYYYHYCCCKSSPGQSTQSRRHP